MSEHRRRRRRAPLAYMGARADAAFWSRHWEEEDLDHQLEVVARSPATAFLERHIRKGERMLEAGCGLGAYVVHFARRGVDVVGVDFSKHAVALHRARFPESDVRAADLRSMPFMDRSFDVYVSLGVIEHYEAPEDVLAEARRVLRDSGRLLLSVPYLNGVRRMLRRRIETRERARARAGAVFYQYAFDEATLDAMLTDAGFEVVERSYYDIGRGWRELIDLSPSGGRARSVAGQWPARPHRRTIRAFVYATPVLRAFAHMQVVFAVKQRRIGGSLEAGAQEYNAAGHATERA